MPRIRLQPVSNFILIPIKVIGIDGNSFRDIEVALDTGASTTSIPMYVASALGYNVSNSKDRREVVTGSDIFPLSGLFACFNHYIPLFKPRQLPF